MQPSGIRYTPATYGIPAAYGTSESHTSSTGPTRGAYIQPSCTGHTPAANTPTGTGPTSAANMKPPGMGLTTTAYTQQSGTGPPPAAYTAPTVKNPSSVIKPPVITTAKTGPTPTFALELSGAATLSASAQFASSTTFHKPSALAQVDISPIYSTQPSSTQAKPAVCTQISRIGSTHAIDTEPSSTGPAHAVQTPASAINPLAAMSTTSTGYCRELSNLAKTYTNDAKYSGCNDSFTFKLAILHDIYSRAGVPPKAKMQAFPTMLKGPALDKYPSNISISGNVMNSDQIRYSIRRKCMKYDKTKDNMDETRIG